jgi:hypothetical protein
MFRWQLRLTRAFLLLTAMESLGGSALQVTPTQLYFGIGQFPPSDMEAVLTVTMAIAPYRILLVRLSLRPRPKGQSVCNLHTCVNAHG